LGEQQGNLIKKKKGAQKKKEKIQKRRENREKPEEVQQVDALGEKLALC